MLETKLNGFSGSIGQIEIESSSLDSSMDAKIAKGLLEEA